MFIFSPTKKKGLKVNKGALGCLMPPGSREARRRQERIARAEALRQTAKTGKQNGR